MASQAVLSRDDQSRLNSSLSSAHFYRNMKQVEDIIEKCQDKSYALHNSVWSAARLGKMEYLRDTLSNNQIDLSWGHPLLVGRTALHVAALKGHKEVIELLISNGADKDATDMKGNTLLHFAARSGDKGIFEYVRGIVGDTSPLNNDGDTIIHEAAYWGQAEVLKYLVNKGEDITVVNNNGQTPLHKAAAPFDGFYTAALEFLIGLDVNLTSLDKNQNTPLNLAEKEPSLYKEQIHILKEALTKKGLSFQSKQNKPEDQDGSGDKSKELSETVKDKNPSVTEKQDKQLQDYTKLLDNAKAEGFITTKWSNISVVGASGTGKTSTLNLLLNKEPVEEHHSTPAVQKPEVFMVDQDQMNDSDDSNSSSDESTDDEDKTVSEVKQSVIIADDSGCWKATDAESTKRKLAQALKQQPKRKSRHPQSRKQFPFDYHAKKEGKQSSSPPTSEASSDPQAMKSKFQHRPMSRANMELIELLCEVERSEELHKAHWIYATDSGGQAPFLDVAPALLRYNSSNLIVVKLDEELDSLADFFYSIRGKRVGKREKRKISTLQLILNFFNCKSQLQAPLLKGVENLKQQGETCFLVIGTHYDKYKALMKNNPHAETLKKKNECLFHHLRNYAPLRRDYDADEKEIIFPINTLGRKTKQLKIAKRIRQITTQSCIEGEVPVRWFIFHLDLQVILSGRNMISLDECFEIGESSGMGQEEVKAALCFYHSLTVYLYFHSILPNVVFINPQPLFDRLSELMAISFGSDKHSAAIVLDLKKKGVFKRNLLDSMEFDKQMFTADDFVKLMKELLIITELPEGTGYFIPCVLEVADEPDEDVSHDDAEPLILTWGDSPIPNGLFPALVVHLLGIDSPKQFRLGNDIYRNKITLKCPALGGTLVLIDQVIWLGIYYFGPLENCSTIRRNILDGIARIVAKFEWKNALACPIELFQCKCTRVSPPYFHFCELNKKSSQLTCTESKARTPSSTKYHLSWFCTKDDQNDFEILKKSPDRTDVFSLIKCHSAKWDEFARELKVLDNTRESLRRNGSLVDEGRLEFILKEWIESHCSPVTWERILDVLSSMLLNSTASKVLKFLNNQEVIDKYSNEPDFASYDLHRANV